MYIYSKAICIFIKGEETQNNRKPNHKNKKYDKNKSQKTINKK